MTSLNIPKKLAIYYSYPSLVNGSNGNISSAVNTFKMYDQIILGAGLENTSHPDHNNTIAIINHQNMVNTNVFGYIDSTRAINDFQKHVNLWNNMGIKGIFCDQFGYDNGTTRAKQNTIINLIHSKNLIAFVDAWNPDDVFSSSVNPTYNPIGTASVINSNDWYLSQSYQIINGQYESVNNWTDKSNKLVNYAQSFGTKIACITTYDTGVYDQTKMDYAYFSCVLYNFHSFGWGEFNYSASTALLPFRQRKTFYGTEFTGNLIINNGIFEKQTNVGINVNTVNHTESIIL